MKMRFILLGGVFVSATLGVRADLVVNQSTAVPGAITPVSSSDSFVPSSTRRYVWQADPAATWYELYVTHNGSVFCDQWYASTNSLVDIATGNFAVDVIGHGGGTHDPGLARMKLQADPGHPFMQRGQDLAGLVLADAVDHRVICIPLEPDQRELSRQPGIERNPGPGSGVRDGR